jgi:hypothetical protein
VKYEKSECVQSAEQNGETWSLCDEVSQENVMVLLSVSQHKLVHMFPGSNYLMFQILLEVESNFRPVITVAHV